MCIDKAAIPSYNDRVFNLIEIHKLQNNLVNINIYTYINPVFLNMFIL